MTELIKIIAQYNYSGPSFKTKSHHRISVSAILDSSDLDLIFVANIKLDFTQNQKQIDAVILHSGQSCSIFNFNIDQLSTGW